MYQKEIIYMGLHKDGSRIGSAGFLKAEKQDKTSMLTMTVKNIPRSIEGRFPVRYSFGADDPEQPDRVNWKEEDEITLRDGGGVWKKEETEGSEWIYVQILLPNGYLVEGKSKAAVPKWDIPAAEPISAASQPVVPPRPPLMADALAIDGLKEDKWEQILDTYDQIHPYGDDRVYVKIAPKDFIILSGNCQHLVNNSFLLHGFYNYRYVILGRGENAVSSPEREYFLGVPGVFYEREKMVALMFGFEAFECEGGDPKPGDFGYYLRKVEL